MVLIQAIRRTSSIRFTNGSQWFRSTGSDAAFNAAAEAMAELTQWTSRGRKDHEALTKAYDDYVKLVRNDLGVSEPAGKQLLPSLSS